MNTSSQNTLQFPQEIPVGGHYRLWLLLGEVTAVLREVQAAALPPAEATEVEESHLLRCAQAIAAANGNPLTENELCDLLKRAEGSGYEETTREREILNVVRACHGLVGATRKFRVPKFDTDYLGRINVTVLDELALPDGETAGVVRSGEVEGTGLPAAQCRLALESLCPWLDSETFAAESAEMQGIAGILRALMAHVYLLRIRPYADGNARTARLAELFLLMKAGIPCPAAFCLSVHYTATRTRFMHELGVLAADDAARWDGFFIYALEGWRDSLRTLLADIREHQLRAAWRLHVEEHFRNSPTEKTGTRRRDLLLSLPAEPTPIAGFADIPQAVFYTHYRHKNLRTLSRDLAELVRCGLLESTGKGFRPRRENARLWEIR